MKALDLYCGAGGMSMGIHRAGFDVTGVDIRPQPNYPFEFHQADVLDLSFERLRQYDAVFASPPCQHYSVLRHANVTKGSDVPDLVGATRERLEATGVPWGMENVPGAPLRNAIVLCGSMFGLGAGERQLRRHRLFESNQLLMQPQCQHRGEAIGVYGGGPVGRYTFENGIRKGLIGRRGGYQGTVAEKAEAMGVDWMTAAELNQAIPPAYGKFVAEQILNAISPALVPQESPQAKNATKEAG